MTDKIVLGNSAIDPVSVDHRVFLENRLDMLDAEIPKHVFSTSDRYKIIIRNKSGSDVYGGLATWIVFGFFQVPGQLNRIDYHGITLYTCRPCDLFAGKISLPDGGWIGFDRRTQADVPLEEVTLGFDIGGVTHEIYPHGNDVDAGLIDRIVKVFRKYGTFEETHRKKSKYVRPVFDAARSLRTYAGLQKPLETKLLSSGNE